MPTVITAGLNEQTGNVDVIMGIVLPYMRSQPMRPVSLEMLKGLGRALGKPRLFEPMLRLGVAPHAEYLDETFEHPLTKGVLSAMAAFLRMTLDATAWPMMDGCFGRARAVVRTE